MNIEKVNFINLKRMFNHILLNVPEKQLNMKDFRHHTTLTKNVIMSKHECNSVGCIIGHCVILDDLNNIPFSSKGNIQFILWSEKFTGIKYQELTWDFLFSSDWSFNKKANSKEQILARLEYFIKNKKTAWVSYSDFDCIIDEAYRRNQPYELN